MRIDARFQSLPTNASASQRSGAAQRFTLGGSGETRRSAGTGSAAPLGSMDALLAVQGEGDLTERRRRSVKRGHTLLDALDRLKAALLSGKVESGQLQNLAAQVSSRTGPTGDPGLDDLVAHIELRAQVELAKLGRAAV